MLSCFSLIHDCFLCVIIIVISFNYCTSVTCFTSYVSTVFVWTPPAVLKWSLRPQISVITNHCICPQLHTHTHIYTNTLNVTLHVQLRMCVGQCCYSVTMMNIKWTVTVINECPPLHSVYVCVCVCSFCVHPFHIAATSSYSLQNETLPMLLFVARSVSNVC